ncbi:MAG: hypothetical protein H7A45_07820 [Verrucomicrobiales bacterium]|nr:hypothetical protein [Verrucomicrobiales bacterium]MCP5527135.1 hypothetical protein [Verrucomicrobiales bacterium]
MSAGFRGFLAGLVVGAVAILALWLLPRASPSDREEGNPVLAGELEQARAEVRALRDQNAEQAAALQRFERSQSELLRLRGEVTLLREAARQGSENRGSTTGQGKAVAPSSPASGQPGSVPPAPAARVTVGSFRPADSWEDVGSETPEEALESLHQAMRAGDQARVAAAYLPPEELLAMLPAPEPGASETPLPAADVTLPRTEAALAGSTILAREDLPTGDVRLEVENQHVDGTVSRHEMIFRKTAHGWKLAPNIQELLVPGEP